MRKYEGKYRLFLDHYSESFINNRVFKDRFKNASEVIPAGLRWLEEEKKIAGCQRLKNSF